MIKSTLPTMETYQKKVFLRADLNVPLHNGTIMDDYRLQALVPTIDLLLQKKSTIIIASHLGRPHGREAALSTRHLIPWFKARGYSIQFHEDILQPIEHQHACLFLLENLRFYAEEKTGNKEFAQTLARFGDFYVNDAFGALHRHDTSLVELAYEFDRDHRSIGLLVEKELAELSKIRETPQRPFALVLGGGKVSDKLPVIDNLINHLDALLIGPGICFTFLKALGKPVGKSLVDAPSLNYCASIIKQAQEKGITLLLPEDFYITHDSFNSPLIKEPITADDFPPNGIGITIGPQTSKRFCEEIMRCTTIFYNGLMGNLERPDSLHGVKEIFQAMALSAGNTIIGGGDSVAAVRYLNMQNQIDFLSTGGGATLAFLSGASLPGLQPF